MTYELHGFKWDLDPRRYIDSKIIDGTFEVDTLRHIVKDILRPGDAFIDVGANIGWYTLFGARAVGASGRVIAVEPELRARNRLRKHIDWYLEKHDGDISVVEEALSDKAGVACLYVKDRHGECMSSIEYAPDGFENAIEVATMTLDQLVASKDLSSVRLMKLDVEGAEYAVLRGGTDSFRKQIFDYVMLEFAESNGASNRFKEMVDFLSDHGYSPEIPAAMDEIFSGRISLKQMMANLFFRREGAE